ncbi:DUF427 domain-containing protein [Tropicimonas sp. IMCC6043]|uniref:DUF427 domain-containing protein n=1 Tax=Tropicimonas sp. IMCC6043 TaxID=2510645 RepID=UPI00101C9A2D|nr:DUF427 domain-containing protein [Tropicimonas sp. IMCC6043]RYH07675.1 DUF427 domain-containing protein [Tropicimonas sp. IMCC6043]
MVEHIKIRKAEGTWVVRAGGAVLGESVNALELSEGEMSPVIYFPREDIAMAFLEASDQVSHSPHKGDARFYSIHTKSRELKNAAWSYEAPLDVVQRIKDHVAFYADGGDVAIERV